MLQIESNIGFSMQIEKSQPEGKWKMPETRFTEFPAKGFLVCIGDRCFIIFWSSDVTLNVACELSQPMGKKEFFSTAKKVNKLCLI